MVRPVELQDVFAKTQAAERITQLQKSQPENQQQQAAAETTRKNQAQQRKPVPSARTDEVILHREQDAKEKKDKKKQSREKADGEPEQTEISNDTGQETQADAEHDGAAPKPDEETGLDVTV
jgi:hypothetical protein